MDTKTKFGADLYIGTGDDHPEIITKITGVDYSKIIVKGAPIIHGRTKAPVPGWFEKYNVWIYKSQRIEAGSEWELETSMQRLLATINSQREKFKELLVTYPENHLLVYLYIKDYHISYLLTEKTIQNLNYYGLTVKFDFYSLPREDEDDNDHKFY
jgi:hypothetical protein